MRSVSDTAVWLFLCAVFLAAPATVAQTSLSAEESDKVSALFDSRAPDVLKCELERWPPALDFVFRYMSGYIAYCRLRQFGGRKTEVVAYVRITPEGKAPTLFESHYLIPEISDVMRKSAGTDLRNLKEEIGFSGAFGLGTGKYKFELLVEDGEARTYRKNWKLRVQTKRSDRGVALALHPLTLEASDSRFREATAWRNDGKLRLSILLDAAPMNPYQSSLRAWDRELLLESLYSVLRQTPHQSIHLVAFNLEQQRELFRSDNFDATAFQALLQNLSDAELSSVSVQALRKRDSPEFLIALANQELAADRSDAIIFLGPNMRMETRMSVAALTARKAHNPPFFYFEFHAVVGAPFPDSIAWLVKEANGRVFAIHSPAELDNSIDKMLGQLKQQ